MNSSTSLVAIMVSPIRYKQRAMAESSRPLEPGLKVFSYAVADKAALYVAVVDALIAAKERFTLQLRPAEVAHHLAGVSTTDVAEALEALETRGNVTKFYDTSAPETLDQFYARRFLYQLTEAGVAAHRGIEAVRRAGLDGGRLSAVLLPSIIEHLNAIRHEARGDQRDGARLYQLFTNLFGSFADLADNAARYMNDLAVEITIITGDDESFSSYKRGGLRLPRRVRGPARHHGARDRVPHRRPRCRRRRLDRGGRRPGHGAGTRR